VTKLLWDFMFFLSKISLQIFVYFVVVNQFMIHPLINYIHILMIRLNSNEHWQLEWGIQCRMN